VTVVNDDEDDINEREENTTMQGAANQGKKASGE